MVHKHLGCERKVKKLSDEENVVYQRRRGWFLFFRLEKPLQYSNENTRARYNSATFA